MLPEVKAFIFAELNRLGKVGADRILNLQHPDLPECLVKSWATLRARADTPEWGGLTESQKWRAKKDALLDLLGEYVTSGELVVIPKRRGLVNTTICLGLKKNEPSVASKNSLSSQKLR